MAQSVRQLFRKRSTTREGNDFSLAVRQQVWSKGAFAGNRDPAVWRLDTCGALIKWSDYGITTENGNGWEIDHIIPVAHNGSDAITNLQPLQWENNRHKSDSLSANYCLMRFGGQ